MPNILLLIMSLIILGGCAKMTLKRSANNELIDTGFTDEKRLPVYNKKYIIKAKHNVANDNDDEIDAVSDDEEVKSETRNRMIYKQMLERDKIRKRSIESKNNIHDYPMLEDARKRIDSNEQSSRDLQKELSDIKKILSETKRDMAKYRCPAQSKNIDELHTQSSPPSLANE